MFEIMRQHAISSVWCSPEQDNQIRLAGNRITRKGGEIVSFPVMGRQTKLPRNDRYYHVYKVGQANPIAMGLIPNEPAWMAGQWRKFSSAVNTLPLFCDLYTDSGVHLPLHTSYYMYTEDRALIFCVELSPKIAIDYDAETIYLRVYTNAYFSATESDSVFGHTHCEGLTVMSTNDLTNYQTIVANWRSQGGAVYCYVNGNLRSDVSVLTAQLMDIVEIVHDKSVKRVVNLQVRDLHTFDSSLDSCFKYLLHYPETTDEIIDFVDDIDVYIIDKATGQYTGRYVHRNKAKNFQMVTHRDYSLSVDVFTNVANGLMAFLTDTALDIRDFYVRMYIRHSGLTRALVYDNHRLFELYKLPEEKIKQALTGVHSVVSFWSAAELEASSYVRLFRERYENIDIGLVEDAFGYNAISKYLGDTPVRGEPYGEFQIFKLPPGLISNSTVFEYDNEGHLLEYHPNEHFEYYISKNPLCRIVEVISGEGNHEPSVLYGTDIIFLPKNYSFRVYKSYLNEHGESNGVWFDITGSSEYVIEDDMLRYTADEEDYLLMVRTDKKFLCYDLMLPMVAGTLYFDLSEFSNGNHRVLPVPGGDMDLWLNGHSLIYGLDYFVEFPRVYVVNKDYLVQPAGTTEQKLTIRITGFAEKDGEKLISRKIEDFGFIVHGTLSNNHKYDIRDDKVLRITVKGKLKTRDELTFSEFHEGVSVVNEINGLPYQVKEMIVPIKDLAYQETYVMRQQALVIDKAVSDYMTIKAPQPDRTAVSAMYNRHVLYSPFFSHLINDLASGQFDITKIQNVELTKAKILEICQPYEQFLKYDPIAEHNGVDQRFVVVHPHQLVNTIELDIYSYTFIKQVVKQYGRGLVVLAQHLTLRRE